VTAQYAHWSAFERRLERSAGPSVDVSTWVVEQLNLRGFGVGDPANLAKVKTTIDGSFTLEDLVIGLLRLSARVEPNHFALVLRVLHSSDVSASRLHLAARRERVDHVLHWLVSLVPPSEWTSAFERVAATFATPPRGYRGVDWRYEHQPQSSR
jgi:hypothetical protein